MPIRKPLVVSGGQVSGGAPTIIRDSNGVATGIVDPSTGGSIPSSAASDAYTFSGWTGGNDTALFQTFLDDMSATATAAKKQLKLILPKNSTGLIDGVFLRSNIDLDLNGSRLVKITNADYSGAGALTAKSSVFKTQVSKNGNTWYGNADNITVRNGILDANNKDCLAVLDLYGVREFVCDGVTLITSQWSRNWATRGGGYARMLNGKILGQAGLFQDGAHWQYGGAYWDNWYIESGDDALAAGDDAVNANVYMDDEGLDYFVAKNIYVVGTRGAALKVYSPATKPFSGAPNNYVKTGKVKNVDVQVTGKSGLLRNGGISILHHANANSRNPDDLKNIRVHADLEVGTAGNAVWDAVSGVIVGSPTSVSATNPLVVTLNGHGLAAGTVVHLMPEPGGMSNLNGFYQVMATNLTANTFQVSDIAYRNNVALSGSGFRAWTTGSVVSVGSGSGYTVGDELTLSGGTYTRPARYLVTQVSGSGAVEAVRRLDEGLYSVLPSTPNSPTGGTGTGCTLQLFLVHDGINAYGVKSYAGKNALITGSILINDTTAAGASRFLSFNVIDTEALTLKVFYPKVPAGGAYLLNESTLQLSKDNVLDCRMVCNGPLSAGLAPIMVLNSANTTISGSIEELPSNTNAVIFAIGGNILGNRAITAIAGSTTAAFTVTHGGWKAGQIVRISGNTLSTGSLDGYYFIKRVVDANTLNLKTLGGVTVGLGANTVTTAGSIEVANNTAKIVDLTVTPAANATSTIGINAASSSPHRVSSVSIVDCNLSAVETAIGTNITLVPMGYVSRDNKT